MIDLHCHSHFSDGTLSPTALLAKALEANIRILALTDHDTTAGLAELHAMAKGHAISIVNGIEFSTRWKKYDIHVLGLQVDPEHLGLQALIEQQNTNRVARAVQIGDRLAELGIADTFAKSCVIAGHERVGRPHFAQALINEGVVPDMRSAFKRYLGRGKKGYVPTPWLDLETATCGIKAAGGQAVLAHPLKYALTNLKLNELIRAFKMAGGDGLEVISGEMTSLQIQCMADFCARYALLASSGSDYHGDNMSRIALGRQARLPVNCTPIWHQWDC